MNKSQFFKYLSSGGKVKVITWHGQQAPSEMQEERYAVIVQSNAIKFNNGSWLYKDDVKASDVTEVYAGGTHPAVNIGWATYQLTN